MYAVSFRIPYEVLGQRAYVNGSLINTTPLKKGQLIAVINKSQSPVVKGLTAEVIESNKTTRSASEFRWGLFDE